MFNDNLLRTALFDCAITSFDGANNYSYLILSYRLLSYSNHSIRQTDRRTDGWTAASLYAPHFGGGRHNKLKLYFFRYVQL